jgi:hypothetical protein
MVFHWTVLPYVSTWPIAYIEDMKERCFLIGFLKRLKEYFAILTASRIDRKLLYVNIATTEEFG